jgi:diketogulonate reductase-like aldo/keto reductase
MTPSPTSTPTYELLDGTVVPAIGFGTYPLSGEDGVEAIASALHLGYRLLDSAVNYGNETEVGQALRRSEVPREEVLLATKVPGRFHRSDLAVQSVRDSAERMGVEQLDLALIHWPNPSQGLYVDAWRGLVQARQEGLVRSIGVSNFTAEHLQAVIDDTGVTPVVNQVELHPYFPQADLLAVHQQLGIRTQAWSPLGKAATPHQEQAVTQAAQSLDVTPAQVVLRWHVQRGSLPVPKSATPERQRANLDVFSFELSEDQMDAITALGRADGRLFGGDPTVHEEM